MDISLKPAAVCSSMYVNREKKGNETMETIDSAVRKTTNMFTSLKPIYVITFC